MIKENFHYDQRALFELFLDFLKSSEGVEVTDEDCLAAFRAAKTETKYFQEV